MCEGLCVRGVVTGGKGVVGAGGALWGRGLEFLGACGGGGEEESPGRTGGWVSGGKGVVGGGGAFCGRGLEFLGACRRGGG